MKRKIGIALLLTLVLSTVLLTLAGCNLGNAGAGSGTGNGGISNGGSNHTNKKQTPVYQGMTITSAEAKAMSASAMSNGKDGFYYEKDNGNHNGHFKGDHAGKDEEIDQANPFPENSKNENIEEEIKSSLNVIGSPDDIYYATPGEDIYINIHINNPDSFEIISFTLNGKKYSSYMFENGSDMETIVLKYNVGNTAGIVQYTIDAIKYIDGTEIKDVLIDGNKTVMAGIQTENQMKLNLSGVDIDTNAISFDANIKDSNALIEFSKGALKAVLYDGSNLICQKELTVGDNKITFDGLKTGALYQYAIVGYYDDLSGDGFGMHVLYKDAFYSDAVVLFDSVTVGQESLSYGLLWHEDHQGKQLSALKLYKGDQLVSSLNASTTKINNLLSNTAYKLVAEYKNGKNTESIYIEFTTLEKAIPEISIVDPTKTQTSVGFTITETDADSVGALTKIELVHANGAIAATSLDQRTFENLLSNNTYTVKVTYTYNLNDGTGEKTIVKELAITTDAKATPSFTVKNESITTDSICAEYDITDADSVLSSYKVELYTGDTLAAANDENKIEFTALSYYTAYTLKITYTFDLSDGKGMQTEVLEKSYKTLPFIDVTSCDVINTSAVSEGETIYMQVNLNNPSNATVESVVINGQTYRVTEASTKNKIFVEIVYNGQFSGGDTYLKIDTANVKIDNTAYSVTPKTELSDNVFIYGKLEVLKIEFVDESFSPFDGFASSNEKVYVLITLNNPTGYNLDVLDVVQLYMITDLIKIDNDHWYYEYTNTGVGWNTEYLGSLTYSLGEFRGSNLFEELDKREINLIRFAFDTVHYISDAEDLKHIKGYNYYELTNDIDLAGLEWQGSSFNGFLNGNGYAIKNMSFVGTIQNSNCLGLFSSGSGIIQNLHIQNATIIADNDAYCGGFVAKASGILRFENCSIDQDSTIHIKNDTGSYASHSYAGGFVGYVDSGATVTIFNSINGANISAPKAGGLIGGLALSKSNTVSLRSCVNIGEVYASDYVPGLVCQPYGGGLVGDGWDYWKDEAQSSYSLFIVDPSYDGCNGEICTIEQLNTKEFYTETLGWSEDVWDFSVLDVENGKIPVLK